MRIVAKRSGGYAGVESLADVDTSRLEPERARQIEQLVRDAAAEAARGDEIVGADLMRYEITIEEDGRTRQYAWTDDGRPEPGPIKRLIEEVGALR